MAPTGDDNDDDLLDDNHEVDVSKAVDVREWLASGKNFGNERVTESFLDALDAAGATSIGIVDYMLVVTLPSDPDGRARLIAMYNTEIDTYGEEFGGEDVKGHLMTRAEALAAGHPEAEGEWVADDFHIVDRGQTVLRFWWD